MLRLRPLRFQCVGGCWDGTKDCYDFDIERQDALNTQIDLIHDSARSHSKTWLDLIHPPFLFSALLACRMRPPARRAWPIPLSSIPFF
jgi:hypothetical protein